MRLMRTNIVSGRSRTGNRSSHPALLCRAHLALYLLAVCFLAGTILGTVASVHADTQIMQRFDFLFQTSASLRLSEPVYSLFFASFASSFLFLMICFLCGLSMWGFLFVPAILFFNASRIMASVCASTAERESSKIITGVCSTSIRAIATRCFCHPESVTPRSPTMVS